MRLACKDLPIRVLQPAGDDLFIGKIECMLEVQEAGDETRAQNRPARPGLKRLGGAAVNGCPVDHVGQFHKWMLQVDMVATGSLACCCAGKYGVSCAWKPPPNLQGKGQLYWLLLQIQH
jgi:hypothetical protein